MECYTLINDVNAAEEPPAKKRRFLEEETDAIVEHFTLSAESSTPTLAQCRHALEVCKLEGRKAKEIQDKAINVIKNFKKTQ